MTTKASGSHANRRKHDCLWCGGSGWVEAYQRPDFRPGHTLAFRCGECGAADDRGIVAANGVRTWQSNMDGEKWLAVTQRASRLRLIEELATEAGHRLEPLHMKKAREARENEERLQNFAQGLENQPELSQAQPQSFPTAKEDAPPDWMTEAPPPRECPF